MRISDWSSDVCSSDLEKAARRRLRRIGGHAAGGSEVRLVRRGLEALDRLDQDRLGFLGAAPTVEIDPLDLLQVLEIGRASCRERSVSVRVDLSGRRIINKKNTDNSEKTEREKQ